MADEDGFTLAEATAIQRRLRQELGLGPERFPLPALVGMLSDEIEQMRAAGAGDARVAAIIVEETGQVLDAAAIGRFYAPPEQRRQ